MNYTIGVDIGGTKIGIGLVNENGVIIRKQEIPTGPDFSSDVVIYRIVEQINSILNRQSILIDDITSIGFGLPGTNDSNSGFVEKAPNLGWNRVPFGDKISSFFKTDLYFIQETYAAALAEFLFGAGQGCENVVCVAIGTGVGCGMILNGKLYRGTFNTAGEFGHLLVEKDGNLCSCGKRGCLEAYGSGLSIEKYIKTKGPAELKKYGNPELFCMAQAGREDIKSMITQMIDYIGIGLVNIVNLLSPDKILLTGGLAEQTELVIEPLKKFVKEHAYEHAADKVIVEKAALGKDAPLIGAAMLNRSIFPYSRKYIGVSKNG